MSPKTLTTLFSPKPSVDGVLKGVLTELYKEITKW